MAKKLKDLVVTKVSLVPKGSNPDADVALFKSADPVAKITFDEVMAGHPEGVREALWKIYDLAYAFTNTAYANMMGGKNVVKDMEKSVAQFSDAVLAALAEASITKATKETADAVQATVLTKAREFLATHAKETTVADTIKKREDMTKEELLAELTRVETAKAAPAPAPTPTVEELAKSEELSPVVKAALAAQAEEIKKANERATSAEAVAKAERDARELTEMTAFVTKEMPNIPGTAVDIAKGLIEAKSKMSKESYDLVVKSMTAGSAGIAKAMQETGVDDVNAALGSAFQKLEAIAKKLQEGDAKLTPEQAFTKALNENPDLYAAYRQENPRSRA